MTYAHTPSGSMNHTIRLSAATPRGWLAGPIGALFFLAVGFGGLFADLRVGLFALVFYIPMALLSIVEGVRLYRWRGWGAMVDPEGVGAELNGHVLWKLPWDQFGGYRAAHVPILEWVRHPERAGIEVLDSRGVAVGRLPLLLGRRTNDHSGHVSLTQEFLRQLQDRVPEQGTKPPEPAPRPPMSAPKATVALALGFLLFAVLLVVTRTMVREAFSESAPTSPYAWLWHGTGVLLQLSLYVVATVAVSVGAMDLTRRFNLIKPPKEELPPEEGPTIRDRELELTLGAPSLMLVPGIRYRTVDPQALARRWRTDEGSVKVCLALFGSMAMLVVVAVLNDPKSRPMAYAFLPPIALLAAVGVLALRRFRLRRESLHDTLVYEDGQLIVVKPDGSHRVFEVPQWREVKNPLQCSEILKNAEGPYYLDRARLYACEDPLDDELRAG